MTHDASRDKGKRPSMDGGLSLFRVPIGHDNEIKGKVLTCVIVTLDIWHNQTLLINK